MDRRGVLRALGTATTAGLCGLAGCSESSGTPADESDDDDEPATVRTVEGAGADRVQGDVRNSVGSLDVENLNVVKNEGGTLQVGTDIENGLNDDVGITVSLYRYNRTIAVYNGDGEDVTADESAMTGPDGDELGPGESANVLFTAEVEAGESIARYEIIVNCDTSRPGKLC